MKLKRNWPDYIQDTLEELDNIWNPQQLHKHGHVVARYLSKHKNALLKARYDLAIMLYYITSRQSTLVDSIMTDLKDSAILAADPKVKGLYYLFRSRLDFHQKDSNVLMADAELALDIFRKHGYRKLEAQALIHIYNIITYFNRSTDYEAIDLLWQVIAICDELGINDEVTMHLYSVACPGIAFLYVDEEKYDEALNFLQKPYQKLKDVGGTAAFHIRMLMGSTLASMGRRMEALEIFTALYNPNHSWEETSSYLFVCDYLLRCALITGTFDKYLKHYSEYMVVIEKVKQPHETIKAQTITAQKEALAKNKTAALAALAEAKNIIVSQNLTDYLYRIYHDAEWRVYEMLGDYKAGWEAYRNYETYRHKNKTSVTDKKIEILKNKVEMATKAKENALLKSELNRQERDLELTATFLRKKNAMLDDILTFTNTVTKKHRNQTGLFEIKRKLISIKAEDTDREKVKELIDKNNQQYIKGLVTICPAITNAEAKICALIKAGLANKEIASLMVASPRTIDTHRSNIRKKLGLGKADNLERVLRTFENFA